MDNRRRPRTKKKLRITPRFLIVCAAALVLVAGAIGAYYLLNRSTVQQAALTETPFTANDQFVYVGNGFFYIQGQELYYPDPANSKNTLHVGVTNSVVRLAASNTIYALYNDVSVKIIGEEFPVEFAGTLTSVQCGKSYIAALRKDASGEESIEVFGQNGAKYDTISAGDQYIVDYGFFEGDSEYLYVVGLTVNSSAPLSTITIYNISRKSTSGVIQVQSQLVEDMRFTRGSIYTVGTNQISRYALSDNTKSYSVTIYGWKVMDYYPAARPVFLLRPRSGTALGTVKLLQISDDGIAATTEQQLQLPASTLDAFLMNGKLVAVSANGYTTYDMNGRQTGEYTFASPVDRVQKLDSTTLLLYAGSACYTTKIA
ncbi:DUF5711 family protein [Christensenellaceae bacterium OttesenSCG-928-L17]|nr:DUF5711 family protein [Christensenellaceae bacterium OttesenSCG-928-L17]